jgi:hypothetical protein
MQVMERVQPVIVTTFKKHGKGRRYGGLPGHLNG